MKFILAFVAISFCSIIAYSQIPHDYYIPDEGLTEENIKSAPCNIVRNHSKYLELIFKYDDINTIGTIVTPNVCYNGSDMSIDLTVNGGVAPYSFEWSGPYGFYSETEDISGLGNGVLYRNNYGCNWELFMLKVFFLLLILQLQNSDQ